MNSIDENISIGNRYCIYHADADGILSAVLINQVLPRVLGGFSKDYYIPAQYDRSEHYDTLISNVEEGDTVYVVDFSLEEEQYIKLAELGVVVVTIDHHKHKIEKLRELECLKVKSSNQDQPKHHKFILDETLSGCELVRKHKETLGGELPQGGIVLDAETDKFIDVIGGRDRGMQWDNKTPPWLRDTMIRINNWFYSLADVSELCKLDGKIRRSSDLERFYRKFLAPLGAFEKALGIGEALGQRNLVSMEFLTSTAIEKDSIVYINNPIKDLTSDLGNNVSATRNKPVVCWYVNERMEVLCSVRSFGDVKPTALSIAKKYGGGGHERAAGFRVPLEQLVEMINE